MHYPGIKTCLLATTALAITCAAQAQAPAGAPNAPDLLKGYSNAPSGPVAGVTYHVGAPDGVTLKDPTTASLPAGCSLGGNTVTCNGDNVQLSGYDFAAHGTQLVLNGGGTISGNTFAMTSCQDPLVNINGTQSVAFSANTVTGNAGQCSNLQWGTLVNAKLAAGTKLTAQYNAFSNVPQDAIDVQGSDGTPANLAVNNNLINGEGWVGHPDGIQTNGGNFGSIDVSGNTYHTANNTVSGTQPLHIEAQLGSNIDKTTVDNNVILTPGSCNGGNGYPNGCVANFDIACKNDPGWTDSNTNFEASGNYIDSSGAIAPTSNNYGCQNASFGSNVNMTSGTPTTQTGGDGQASVPPSGATTTSQKSNTTSGTSQSAETVQRTTAGTTQQPSGQQIIAPGQGTLTDAAGNVWTITPSGSIKEGDTYTPGGGGTSALMIINGVVYGEDSSGKGWFKLSGNGQFWDSVQAPTTTTPATQTSSHPAATTSTTVALPCNTGNKFGVLPLSSGGAGVILDSSGQQFVPRGVNVMYGNGNPSAATLKSTFPGINFVRLPIYHYDSPDSLAPYVNDLTSNGIVVELEDHNNNAGGAGGGQGVIFTGQELATELDWYTAVASAFKNNPYVWFGTDNEPPEKDASGNTNASALSNWQQATYNAIRSAGNDSIVMLETTCWAEGNQPVCNQGYNAAAYAQMSNAVWDTHFYGWLTNFSTDQAANDQFVVNNVAALSSIKSAGDITMPVIIGEYGNSTTGQAIDANGTQAVKAVQNAVMAGKAAGSSAWAWGSGGPGDGLTDGGSGLSGYGQMVAAYIAQSMPGGSAAVTCGGTSQAGTQSTKPNATLAGSVTQTTNQPSDQPTTGQPADDAPEPTDTIPQDAQTAINTQQGQVKAATTAAADDINQGDSFVAKALGISQ